MAADIKEKATSVNWRTGYKESTLVGNSERRSRRSRRRRARVLSVAGAVKSVSNNVVGVWRAVYFATGRHL